jgi:hypothetical protein
MNQSTNGSLVLRHGNMNSGRMEHSERTNLGQNEANVFRMGQDGHGARSALSIEGLVFMKTTSSYPMH